MRFYIYGYTQANMASLRNFRQWQAPTAGIPNMGICKVLKQPLVRWPDPTAVGMAIENG